ncbi:MAG: phenylalanine--tRNA ligase subunit alpha [Chlamydiota bacterium]
MGLSIESIREEFEEDIVKVKNTVDLEEVKLKFLRKKGPIQDLMRSLKGATPEERPILGKNINDLKNYLEERCDYLYNTLQKAEECSRLETEWVDVTMAGRRRFLGRKHIINQILDEALEILTSMGFTVQYGPDIESDYYNFEALNFSPDHPARDMQDTFYINPEMLLRTHTSNTQVRVMEANPPPIRIAIPGKCYRNEAITARSHVFFHQVEGLYIDENVSFADLVVTIEEFFRKLFHRDDLKIRSRPSYFPFVEPGMEVDVNCFLCQGSGCSVCKKTGWLEVAGAGMVHPEVLKSGGIDTEKYSGYAWGIGIERMVMLKYGIKDIRMFTENDMRFLEQFA